MAKRKDFNQTAILKFLAVNKPVCKKCGKDAHQTELDLHHKDGDPLNDDWTNIVIYCKKCHTMVEGRDKKKRDLR